jgi:fructose-bisphosphate aldolase class 1
MADAPGLQEENGEALPDIAAIKAMLPQICRSYAASCMDTGLVPIVDPGAITATEAMIVCSALLRAVDIQVFELGMWQGWNGI